MHITSERVQWVGIASSKNARLTLSVEEVHVLRSSVDYHSDPDPVYLDCATESRTIQSQMGYSAPRLLAGSFSRFGLFE
jgi:hypothetical protein